MLLVIAVTRLSPGSPWAPQVTISRGESPELATRRLLHATIPDLRQANMVVEHATGRQAPLEHLGCPLKVTTP